jgi:hypothetical protein
MAGRIAQRDLIVATPTLPDLDLDLGLRVDDRRRQWESLTRDCLLRSNDR